MKNDMDDNIILDCPYCGGPTRNHGKSKTGKPFRWCEKCKRKFLAVKKFCSVCGKEIPRHRYNGNTCSVECFDKKVKTIQLNHYYKRVAEDPGFNKNRNERNKERPEYIEARKEYYKVKWGRLKSDPEKFELHKERLRQFYAANAKRIQEGRIERIDKMSPEELGAWVNKHREASRKCSARRRDDIKNNPEALKKYEEYREEYKRRKALAKLFSTMQQLEEKL